MFIKNKFLLILLFCLIFGNLQSAYSNAASLYDGRVKFGTYNCSKDGETCHFEVYENHGSYSGGACPKRIKGENYKAEAARIADFLNSEYCSYTSTKIKKYKCSYDVGSATIYVEDGKVKSADYGFDPTPERIGQLLYEPDKCTEVPMNEPSFETNDSSDNAVSNVSNNNENLIRNIVEQSVKKETEALNEKITSLQNETDILKKKMHLAEQNFNYLFILLIIIFIISLIALFKSNNNNPYRRL